MNMPKTVKVGGVSLVIASTALMIFLGRWESRENVVYADKLAANLPTVCKGITRHVTAEPIIVGDYWPDFKCEQIEQMVIAKTQINLGTCFKRPISQRTFDAFSSMAHNVGAGAVCASRAVGLVNQGRLVDGCQAIAYAPNGAPVWSFVTEKGQKRFVRGLHNRRRAEMQMCLGGVT